MFIFTQAQWNTTIQWIMKSLLSNNKNKKDKRLLPLIHIIYLEKLKEKAREKEEGLNTLSRFVFTNFSKLQWRILHYNLWSRGMKMEPAFVYTIRKHLRKRSSPISQSMLLFVDNWIIGPLIGSTLEVIGISMLIHYSRGMNHTYVT